MNAPTECSLLFSDLLVRLTARTPGRAVCGTEHRRASAMTHVLLTVAERHGRVRSGVMLLKTPPRLSPSRGASTISPAERSESRAGADGGRATTRRRHAASGGGAAVTPPP